MKLSITQGKNFSFRSLGDSILKEPLESDNFRIQLPTEKVR